jgi:hypothetical protein
MLPNNAKEIEKPQVLSGCTVRAVIQQEQAISDNERHYFSAILLRLNTLYHLTKEPNVREQISDEVGWVDARLAALASEERGQ